MLKRTKAARQAKIGHAVTISVPADIQSNVVLARIDYAVAFEGKPAPTAQLSAEGWLRRTFEQAPVSLRFIIVTGWRLFGARLGPHPSSEHVLGWRIDKNEPDLIRTTISWRIGLKSNLVLRIDPSKVVLGSFVELSTRLSRVIWWVLTPIPEPLLRLILSLATRRLDAARPA